MNVKRFIPKRLKIFLKSWYSNLIPEEKYLNRSFTITIPGIDFQLTKAQNEELLKQTSQVWEKLGAEEPHWSVLTNSKFTKKNLDKNRREFNKTGYSSTKQILGALNQIGIPLQSLNELTVLEIGSGVGRVTIPLSKIFKKIIATDVSKQHLSILEKEIKEEEINNILINQITKLDDFGIHKNYSGIYSVITLQHNPPPIQLAILEIVLRNLQPGGFFFFQTPTYIPNYEFNIAKYLKSSGSQMEMHPVPMPEVFELLLKNDCGIKLTLRDDWTGREYDSHTFIGVKNIAK
jgi:2-polyprenyl-3-methyl-5-hydroxy-6-metoxy-1,4-benzoquinol methylase